MDLQISCLLQALETLSQRVNLGDLGCLRGPDTPDDLDTLMVRRGCILSGKPPVGQREGSSYSCSAYNGEDVAGGIELGDAGDVWAFDTSLWLS